MRSSIGHAPMHPGDVGRRWPTNTARRERHVCLQPSAEIRHHTGMQYRSTLNSQSKHELWARHPDGMASGFEHSVRRMATLGRLWQATHQRCEGGGTVAKASCGAVDGATPMRKQNMAPERHPPPVLAAFRPIVSLKDCDTESCTVRFSTLRR